MLLRGTRPNPAPTTLAMIREGQTEGGEPGDGKPLAPETKCALFTVALKVLAVPAVTPYLSSRI